MGGWIWLHGIDVNVSSDLPLPQATLPSVLHLLPENPVKAQGFWSLNWLPSERSGSKTCLRSGAGSGTSPTAALP